MAPSITSLAAKTSQHRRPDDHDSSSQQPRKKSKTLVGNEKPQGKHITGGIHLEGDWEEAALPTHPQSIRPLGNLYAASTPNLKIHAGRLSCLPDELLVHILEYLGSRHLLNLGATCKALHAFARYDELWKTLLVESPLSSSVDDQALDWRGTWRATYLSLPCEAASKVDCTGLYSDTLFRPFHCANVPLRLYTNPAHFRSHIPKLTNLTSDEFKANWSDKPFILTEPVKSWRMYREWDVVKLVERYGRQVFRCEAVDWQMQTYVQYMHTTEDESPLYLFDSQFVEKMDLRVGEPSSTSAGSQSNVDYTSPKVFHPDLFTVLGAERPSHRWLIVGPPRSGSSFHTDPNGTSAWNAVIRGRKYWIMCPEPPPGVYVSEDESEVTSPSSIAEWLLSFHAEARRMPGCCEGICEEGEVLHVPGGWYHLVLNLPRDDGSLGDNIAVTQNFVPESRLPKVLSFLENKSDQISGFRFSDDSQNETLTDDQRSRFSAYDLFTTRLEKEYPDALRAAVIEINSKKIIRDRESAWTGTVKNKKDGGAFSFGFTVDTDE